MTSQNDIMEVSDAGRLQMNNELQRPESITDTNSEATENMGGNETAEEENIENIESPHKTTSLFYRIIRNVRLEVLMFLYMFSNTMRTVSTSSMILDKVCRIHLGYSNVTCSNLSEELDIEIEVVKMANNYNLALSLLQTVPAAITILFLGSWSDKYSRKIPIIIGLIGVIIDGVGSSICAHFIDSRVEYFLIPAIFTGISGGYIGILTVLYSYISDVTPVDRRTLKFGLVELASGLSIPLASAAGGWIYKYFGYVPVFVISTCGFILGLFWIILVLEETRGLDNTDSWLTKFRNFWSTEFIVSSFKATLKLRPNKGRGQIWWIIISLSITACSTSATTGIMFYYAHHLYNWDNTMFSSVSAVLSIVSVVAMVVVVPICLRLKIRDSKMCIVGSVSLFLKNLGLALAFNKGIYYAANAAGFVIPLITLGGRPRLSKVTSIEDLGKIFSFLIIAENILPVLVTGVVSQVFNATLNFFPGLIFLLLAVFNLIPLGTFIWITRLTWGNKDDMIDYQGHEQSSRKISHDIMIDQK